MPSANSQTAPDLQCKMERPCEDLDLTKISRFVSSWEAIAPFFGITPEEEVEIRRNYQQYELQKLWMLRNWRSKNGNHATYQKLFDIFTESDQIAIAHRIRDEIVGKQQPARRVEPDCSKPGAYHVGHKHTHRYCRYDCVVLRNPIWLRLPYTVCSSQCFVVYSF